MKTSDTVILGKRKIEGLALTEGGPSSHVAILANSYGIPLVVGLENIEDQIDSNQVIVVNGDIGEVIVNPDAATLTEANTKILSARNSRISLQPQKTEPCSRSTQISELQKKLLLHWNMVPTESDFSEPNFCS